MANYAEDPEQWQARADRLKEKHRNGNGHGTPLAVAVKMLPTPLVGDATGGRTSKGQHRPDEGGLRHTLKMLPTPTVDDAHNVTQRAGEFQSLTRTALEELRLLATPVAADGREKGGGGRWNPDSAPLEQTMKDKLLPTPTAQDAKNSTAPPSQMNRNSLALPSLAVSKSTGASTPEPSSGGKPSAAGLRLNPSFVEWMMGAPEGWSDPDCPLSVTAYLSKRELSSESSS